MNPKWKSKRLFYGKLRRLTRWEHWPTLPLYLPVLPAILVQAIRYRSLAVVTAVNPGMPSGGFVLDSKSDILTCLSASGRVAPFQLIEASLPLKEKLVQLGHILSQDDFSFPIVLKPDFGERGSGVTIAKTEKCCVHYLENATETTVVQKFIPGVEYGVFYERDPDEEKGHITGITHKSTTQVTGNGAHTLEHLILKDKRAVCQAEVFFELQKDRLDEIIPNGEKVSLNLIGTHSRGSLFLDACDSWTQKMEDAVDEMSQHFEGFHLGRYDIRCPSLEALQNGEDFYVVELNGVTSEPTHMYDPRHSVIYAWKALISQWWRAYSMSAKNVKKGHKPLKTKELIKRIKTSQAS